MLLGIMFSKLPDKKKFYSNSLTHHKSCNKLQKCEFWEKTTCENKSLKSPGFARNIRGFLKKAVSFSKIIISWLLTQVELSQLPQLRDSAESVAASFLNSRERNGHRAWWSVFNDSGFCYNNFLPCSFRKLLGFLLCF